jgi:hypothetical protein
MLVALRYPIAAALVLTAGHAPAADLTTDELNKQMVVRSI